MRGIVRSIITAVTVAGLALPAAAQTQPPAQAQEKTPEQKIDQLTKEVAALKQQAKRTEERSLAKWLTVGGDYRFRIDSLRGEVPNYWQFVSPLDAPAPTPGYKPANDTLMTNRFGLNLKARAARDVTVTARLLMYKTFGNGTADATNAGFFADRSFLMDGSVGHVPSDNVLRVDQVYGTWSNIAGQPIWFSAGRRPSTGGSPLHLRQDGERPGNGGVPGLLVDYAFDGMTLGWAPDLLPGMYAKVCYGRGFESGYDSRNRLADTDMVGVQLVPIDIDAIRVDLQWNRGMSIFDNPNAPGAQLGDIDWAGLGAIGTVKRLGPGDLQWFGSAGVSTTHPNGRHALLPGGVDSGAGLLTSGPEKKDRTGYAGFVGVRYDFPSATKLGLEFNHGSQYWIPFDPAGDDMWTSKLGARGNVYEAYLIQELPLDPVSSFFSKAFFKIGYQLYDFQYTGSNNWVGAPVKIADLEASPLNAQMLPPVKTAQDLYATFEVKF